MQDANNNDNDDDNNDSDDDVMMMMAMVELKDCLTANNGQNEYTKYKSINVQVLVNFERVVYTRNYNLIDTSCC